MAEIKEKERAAGQSKTETLRYAFIGLLFISISMGIYRSESVSLAIQLELCSSFVVVVWSFFFRILDFLFVYTFGRLANKQTCPLLRLLEFVSVVFVSVAFYLHLTRH